VRCLAALAETHPPALDALVALTAQLASPPALAALVHSSEPGVDGADGAGPRVGVRERVEALLPVLEVVMDAASGETEAAAKNANGHLLR
jgi:hypothetical protein